MKTLIVIIAALFCFGFQAKAQRPEQGKRMDMTPEQMAEQRTAQMVQKYGLNQEQTDLLFELNKQQMEKMASMRPQRISKDSLQSMSKSERKAYQKEIKQKEESMREDMKKNEEKYEQTLQLILTAEQYAQYQKDRENYMDRREGPPQGGPQRQRSFPDNDDDF